MYMSSLPPENVLISLGLPPYKPSLSSRIIGLGPPFKAWSIGSKLNNSLCRNKWVTTSHFIIPEFYFTRIMITHLGKITFSSSDSLPWLLKHWKSLFGGYLNGEAPKLNSHCWKDMKLAAAKKPVLKHHKQGMSVTHAQSFYLCTKLLYFNGIIKQK